MSRRRRAFVAGGSGALGRAVCRSLLAAGYETHASARSNDHGLHERPGLADLIVHQVDFTSESEAVVAFERLDTPLDALVSTIGGYAGGPLAEVSEGAIAELTALNIQTTALVLRGAYPRLREGAEGAGGAGVVLVAARGALTGGPGAALYSAAKAAVANLALSASREWKKDRISVNAVLPSVMDTPANRRSMPEADFASWPTPDEVAAVIAFLVGPEARIVSGASIPVYGQAW